MTQKKPSIEQRRKDSLSDILSATTRKKYSIPHIAELVEALFDEWRVAGQPPLKSFAYSVKQEFNRAKPGSLQRAKLLELHVRMLELASRTNFQNVGDLEHLSEEDLVRAGREMWADFLPRDDNDAVERQPNAGGSGEAPAEDPA